MFRHFITNLCHTCFISKL